MSVNYLLDAQFRVAVNGRQYAAYTGIRRNAANTDYEYALPVWSDQSYTDPSWLTSIPSTKVTGLGALATLSAAPAGTLTGTTLAANVVSSSLTSVGTLSSALTVSTAGAASAPAMTLTGAWFTSGTATTTKPHLLIEPVGTTSTGWGTAGTGFGVNAANTFLGDLLSLQKNGVNKFSVAYDGRTTIARTTMNADNIVMQVGNGATGFVDYASYYLTGGFYTYQAFGGWHAYGSDGASASILAVGGFRAGQWSGITLHAGGSEILRIQNSGTAGLLTVPAAGVVGLEIRGAASQSVALVTLSGRSSTTDGVAQAAIDTAWVDSTHATRKARLILRAYDTAARDGLIIEATGSAATLASAASATWTGLHNYTAQSSPSALTDYVPVRVNSNSGASWVGLASYGATAPYIASSTTLGFSVNSGNNTHAALSTSQFQVSVKIAASATLYATTSGASLTPLSVSGVTAQSAPVVLLQGASSTTSDVTQAAIDTAWVDSTHATRKARLILRAYDTAARDGLIIEATGSAATLSSAAAATWTGAHTFQAKTTLKAGSGAATSLEFSGAGVSMFAASSQLFLSGGDGVSPAVLIYSTFGVVDVISTGAFRWINGSDTFTGTSDTALTRAAAGVVALSDSGAGSDVALALQAKSSTTAGVDRARFTTAAIDNTHATRKYRLVTSAYDTAARETSRQWADGSAGRIAVAAPASAPTDAHIAASQVSFYLDEGGNNLKFRVCYADGTTYKTGTVALS